MSSQGLETDEEFATEDADGNAEQQRKGSRFKNRV